MPKTKLGCMLSMVDNIDNLTGFFIINKKPSGSKDPFALRRAGFSIVQILMKLKLNISINDLFTEALKSYENTSKIIKDWAQPPQGIEFGPAGRVPNVVFLLMLFFAFPNVVFC